MKKIKKKKIKFELSAGGIIYNPATDKILVIKDQNNRVSFPKGMNDPKEKLVDTAIREAREETGIKKLNLISKLGGVKFFYKFKGELIFKRIDYFLFEAPLEKPKPQVKEIKDALWMDKNKVLKQISFSNLKPLFQKALDIIKQKYAKT